MALRGDVMNCRCRAVGLALVGMLGLVSESAFCQSKAAEPLKLKFNKASSVTAQPASVRANPTSVANPLRRGPRFQQAPPSLSERALQSLLDTAEQESTADKPSDEAMFRFERRGSAGRDLSQSYKAMCQNASEKLWDEPNGKRVKFDIAGKPGVAIEIPLR